MKNLLTILTFILLLASCSKNDDEAKQKSPTFALPPETQIGANTFGVTINGKVYIPRDPTGVSVGPAQKGMIIWGSSSFTWTEIEIKDGASEAGFNMIIHMDPLLSIGQMQLKNSNFQDNIDSISDTHIYFKIWNSNIMNYAYYGSVENESLLNITRLDNGIISGKFSGKFKRDNNPNDIIVVTDGRFDINGFTLPTHPFP